jgi:hypothetical protein
MRKESENTTNRREIQTEVYFFRFCGFPFPLYAENGNKSSEIQYPKTEEIFVTTKQYSLDFTHIKIKLSQDRSKNYA